MFDFGFWEIVLILVVALLVVGPERLPGLARATGLWVGRLKRMARNMKEELEDEIEATQLKKMIDHQQGEIEELRGILKDTRKDIERDFEDTQSTLEDTSNLIKAVEKQLNEELTKVNESAALQHEQDEPPEKNH